MRTKNAQVVDSAELYADQCFRLLDTRRVEAEAVEGLGLERCRCRVEGKTVVAVEARPNLIAGKRAEMGDVVGEAYMGRCKRKRSLW